MPQCRGVRRIGTTREWRTLRSFWRSRCRLGADRPSCIVSSKNCKSRACTRSSVGLALRSASIASMRAVCAFSAVWLTSRPVPGTCAAGSSADGCRPPRSEGPADVDPGRTSTTGSCSSENSCCSSSVSSGRDGSTSGSRGCGCSCCGCGCSCGCGCGCGCCGCCGCGCGCCSGCPNGTPEHSSMCRRRRSSKTIVPQLRHRKLPGGTNAPGPAAGLTKGTRGITLVM